MLNKVSTEPSGTINSFTGLGAEQGTYSKARQKTFVVKTIAEITS